MILASKLLGSAVRCSKSGASEVLNVITSDQDNGIRLQMLRAPILFSLENGWFLSIVRPAPLKVAGHGKGPTSALSTQIRRQEEMYKATSFAKDIDRRMSVGVFRKPTYGIRSS